MVALASTQMRPLIHEVTIAHTPESLAQQLSRPRGRAGVILLRSFPGQDVAQDGSSFDSTRARYSFVAANPFLTFRSCGSRCEIAGAGAARQVQFGNPWHLLDSLMSRYELLEEIDLPFPLGGCFGYWGYDLKNFVEPKLPRRAINDLELPDCHVGFYDSLVVFDHRLGKNWILSTGLAADGSRSEGRAWSQLNLWKQFIAEKSEVPNVVAPISPVDPVVSSNLSRTEFVARVQQAQNYIRSGDIYQVNLSRRLSTGLAPDSWRLFQNLSAVSPAPFAAFLDCGELQIVSSSPEQFLRLSGSHIQTRPIKGTRPRSMDPTRDAQLSYELQTSAKEMSELVMITDLLRNDIGKVCEFGSVQVPELMRLERFAHVQHLVSTVDGRLRSNETHFSAFASCFPGGSITGAPKIRAMEIIDELEPVARGPYTGAIGYLGFNRESQLSITIRTAVCKDAVVHFNVGAGIVADSNPEAEYEETSAKAAGFLAALHHRDHRGDDIPTRAEKES
jgi:para-aminobenzoate synthetase component I